MSSVARPREPDLSERAARLMGGARVIGHRISGALMAHEAVAAGLPGAALHHLMGSLVVLEPIASLEGAIGVSRRTFQRSKAAPEKPLSAEQSGRIWRFAEILALATDVMGTQRLAEEWLDRPAVGLDGRRPIDLLATPAGAGAVELHLQRIKYGVYT